MLITLLITILLASLPFQTTSRAPDLDAFQSDGVIEFASILSPSELKRDNAHYILSGRQTPVFRSNDCPMVLPGNETSYFQIILVNWLTVMWTFTGNNNEWSHFFIEAETRGWVGFGFTDSSLQLKGSEVIIGSILKSDSNLQDDKISLESLTLTASNWDSPKPNSQILLYNTSACQTRDGRTVIGFTRKTRIGKHKLEPWLGSFMNLVVAVGDLDTFGPPIDATSFSTATWQGRIGPEEPEGWSFRWITIAIFTVFHIISWFIR